MSGQESQVITVSWKTYFRLGVAVLLGFLLVKLFPLLLVLFLGFLLGVSLQPVLKYLLNRGIPRWAALTMISVALFGGLIVTIMLILPPIYGQMGNLMDNWPQLRQNILDQIPQNSMFYRPAHQLLHQSAIGNEPQAWLQHLMKIVEGLTEAMTELFLVLIFAVYLLVDGPKAYKWILAFFPVETRRKIHQTAHETSGVVFAYVAGQVITSVLSTIYTFTILQLLHVPAAIILAVLAGICDVLPILGFILSTLPAVLLATLVSPLTALAVLLLYIFYHGLENYFIVPRVYGNRLQISSLAVLVALLASGMVSGILGAIAILPIVASYPIVERIWLIPLLGYDVIEKHADEMEEPSVQ